MPTNEPNNAVLNDRESAPEPTDRDSAAAVLQDDATEQMPGGGGVRGANAGAPDLAGVAGGASPNAPIDTGLSGEGSAERESQRQSIGTNPGSDGRSTDG